MIRLKLVKVIVVSCVKKFSKINNLFIILNVIINGSKNFGKLILFIYCVVVLKNFILLKLVSKKIVDKLICVNKVLIFCNCGCVVIKVKSFIVGILFS